MSILMLPAVMLNAASYIICRYQTEQSIFNNLKAAPSDNASLCHQSIQPAARHQRGGMRLSDLILIPPTTLEKGIVVYFMRLKRKCLSRFDGMFFSLTAT